MNWPTVSPHILPLPFVFAASRCRWAFSRAVIGLSKANLYCKNRDLCCHSLVSSAECQ